jgi:predicted alpha/beta superfamily hydrolase
VDVASSVVTPGPASINAGPFQPPHTLTGRFHLLRQFHSCVLDNERDVAIYLPPGYVDDRTRRYPVLYMHDGQNLFDEVTAFNGREWRLDETTEALINARRIAPLIVVGINHAGTARGEELTPTRDSRRRVGGAAPRYGRFLLNELKPYVDAHYRTRPEREHTSTGGSSLGGLMALYLGFAATETFGRLMVMSPSLWWDRRKLLQEIRAGQEKLPVRIWLDAGTAEGSGTLQNVRMLKNALVRRGWTLGHDLHYLEATGAGHTESAWAARAGAALTFLFPPSGV